MQLSSDLMYVLLQMQQKLMKQKKWMSDCIVLFIKRLKKLKQRRKVCLILNMKKKLSDKQKYVKYLKFPELERLPGAMLLTGKSHVTPVYVSFAMVLYSLKARLKL